MNNRLLKGMVALGLIAAGTLQSGLAQERRLPPAVMGFFGGYDYGHIVPLETSADIIDDPYANEAGMLTGGVTFIFPKIVAEGFGLSTSIGYGRYGFTAGRTGDETIIDQNNNSVLAQTHHSYNFRSQSLMMDVMIYAHIGDIARFEIGPWGGVGFLPSYEERTDILTPGVTFFGAQYSRSQTVHPTKSVVATYGGMIRGSLEVPIFAGMSLLPFAQLRVGGVESNDGDEVGIVGTFGGGLGLLFGQTNGTEIDPPPMSAADTLPPPPAPPAAEPALEAKVDLYSRDRSGRNRDTLLLMAHSTLHRMEVPLMAEFHFERNSAALPARYAGYSAATQSDFTLSTFADKPPVELRRQGLNVIGMRLAASPTATVTITGSALPDEPKWFAGARAEAVGRYLMETWGVGREQIKVKDAGAPKAGASKGKRSRSVTIASASPGVLDPIVTEWIEQEVNPAPIGLQPEIVAPKGVKEWHASVRHGNREIGIVRNTDSSASGMMSATDLLAGMTADGSVPKLSAELIVQDSSGATVVARDELVVVLTRNTTADNEDAIERSITRYFLTGAPGAETDRSIDRIVAAIGDTASISLRPVIPTDAAQMGAQARERLHSLTEQLRSICAARGKRHVTIGSQDAGVMAAGDRDAGSDADPFATPIEITVIN
jgi:hypothetical protein